MRQPRIRRSSPGRARVVTAGRRVRVAAAGRRAGRVPAIGVLVGTSPVDHDADEAGAWSTAVKLVAGVAGAWQAHVVLDRFGSGPQSSQPAYDARVASTNAQNSLMAGVQLQRAENNLVRAFGTEQSTVTPGQTDLIGGIGVLEQDLGAFGHPAITNVVIFGSAIQTTGPVNLSDPVQLADPEIAIQRIRSEGLLAPGSCRGWRVHMVDGGLAPGGGLSDLQNEQLREFWREYFAACGGRLVLWDTSLIAFPASGQVAAASWATGHRQVIVPLAASVLFEPQSPRLLPGAAVTLNAVARLLTRTYPDARASIAGYTAAVGRGPESAALALALARARAVAGYLESSHVLAARLSVHGYGDQDQIASDATAAGQQLNRRVVITITVS